MKKKCCRILLIASLMFSDICNAQTDSSEGNSSMQFKPGVYYNSGLNYYDRAESLRNSILSHADINVSDLPDLSERGKKCFMQR